MVGVANTRMSVVFCRSCVTCDLCDMVAEVVYKLYVCVGQCVMCWTHYSLQRTLHFEEIIYRYTSLLYL